jgi:hypothetical protein
MWIAINKGAIHLPLFQEKKHISTCVDSPFLIKMHLNDKTKESQERGLPI